MNHFAKVENGIVTRVISIKNSDCGNLSFPDSEPIGKQFISSIGLDGEWFETSYEKSFRGQYAGLGMNWNGSVFHGPSPYPSWSLNQDGIWESPVPYPGNGYIWDEDIASRTSISP